MAREQQYTDEEEEEEQQEEEEEEPAPQVKKPIAKKPMPPAKSIKPIAAVPQVQYIKIPIFESQAQQVFYDLLLSIEAKINKLDADLELMKKYLPQE